MTTPIGPISIEIQATGVAEVLKSLQGLQAAAERVEKLSRSARTVASAEAKARLEVAKAATFEAKAKAAGAKQAADVEKAQALGVLKATQQTEKEKTSAVTKESQKRATAVERAKESELRSVQRYADRIVREEKKAADAIIRESKRVAAERKRASDMMAGRITSSLSSTASLAMRGLGMGLSLVGGAGLANTFGKEMSLSTAARNASIHSDVPGSPDKRISAEAIKARSRQLGKEFNIDDVDVAGAIDAFSVKASDGARAMRMAPMIAKLSKAEGVNQTDLAESLGITTKQNPNMTDAELETYGRVLIGQGRAGNVELSEMAKFLPKITSTSAMYEGNQSDNMVKLGSMFQMTYAQTGDVAESAESVTKLAEDVTKAKNRKKINAYLGHDIDHNGKIEDPQMLIAELLGRSKGDVFSLMQNAGLDARGARTLNAIGGQAVAKSDGTAAGIQATAIGLMNDFNKARISAEDVEKHLAERAADDDEKVSRAMRELEHSMIPLIPQLVRFAEKIGAMGPQIERAAEGLSDLVNWIAEHPWETVFAGLGAKVAMAVVGEIVKSELKAMIGAAIAKMLPGATLPGAGGGGTSIVGAALATGAGAMGATAAGAALAVVATKAVADSMYSDEREKMTPDQLEGDIAKRQAMIATLRKQGADDPITARGLQAQIAEEQQNIAADQAKLKEADAKYLGEAIGNGFLETVQGAKFDFMSDNGGTDAGPRGAGGAGFQKK